MQVVYRFYRADTLLFTLEGAPEYDTATPYRYAVGRFVEVAALIRCGEAVTIVNQDNWLQSTSLHTIDDLRRWLSVHFNGFNQYVP